MRMTDYGENICYACVHYPVCYAAEDDTAFCNNYIDRNTIVKHGRWLPCGFGKEIMCSVCGCELDSVWRYKYCPNCGADMRGE